jgi:hypothetical protein
VAHVRTDVSEELSASFVRVTRIDELGTTLAVTSNRRTLCCAEYFPCFGKYFSCHHQGRLIWDNFLRFLFKILFYQGNMVDKHRFHTVDAKEMKNSVRTNKQTNSVAFSPQANYTD